jgi:hypothetical protein
LLPKLAVAALLMSAACGGGNDRTEGPRAPISPIPSNLAAFELSSPAFEEGAAIPEEFTCNGADASPPLQWAAVPEGTAELLLTLQDPDAPSGVFTHWTVFAVDPSAGGLPSAEVPSGALQGTNDFGDVGYGGPCPPEGESHRYFFTLAALAEPSGLEAAASPEDVDAVLQRAVATTTLSGTYPA